MPYATHNAQNCPKHIYLINIFYNTDRYFIDIDIFICDSIICTCIYNKIVSLVESYEIAILMALP